MSWALLGWATGCDAGAFLAGAFLGGAGRAPVRPFSAGAAVGAAGAAGAADEAAASIVARSRRATGASIVLDADFTYSPIS
jgi:hypothetical protein